MSKKTVIVGASENPMRHSFLAAERLTAKNHEIVPLSIHKGVVFGKEFLDLSSKPPIDKVHTLTMYINPTHQSDWEDYLLSLRPKRIIFNPGSENQSFSLRASEAGIEAIDACTLVMLGSGEF